MNRRAFLGTLTVALFALPRAVVAQQAVRVYQVGYLSAGSSSAYPQYVEVFRQGLRELGWVEGQNIGINYRYAEGRLERLPGLAADLVRLKVDVIVATPAPSVAAARNATGTIPIVMIAAFDPVGQGLIASLARPGGNVTGLSYSAGQEIFGKQLALLREVIPNIRRVAVLSNPASPAHASAMTEMRLAARSLGMEIKLLELRDPNEFDLAFVALAKERVGALFIVADPMMTSHSKRLADLAAKSHLPTATTNRLPVEARCLMSYGPSFSDLWRRAGGYVDKILKRAKPADLPVEQPTKFELVINLMTAKALD
jgi:putative ABC transport system substrate-binding protein